MLIGWRSTLRQRAYTGGQSLNFAPFHFPILSSTWLETGGETRSLPICPCKNAAGRQSLLSKRTRRPILQPISRRENWKVKQRKIQRLPICVPSLRSAFDFCLCICVFAQPISAWTMTRIADEREGIRQTTL